MLHYPPNTSLSSNLDHDSWHGYFTGPVGWVGLRVLSYQTGQCPRPYGATTSCRATVLQADRTVLTAENCFDGIDNDSDGLVDKADPDCWNCGDGVLDPGEDCE